MAPGYKIISAYYLKSFGYNFTNIYVTIMKFGTQFRSLPSEPRVRYRDDSYSKNEVIRDFVLTEFP